MPIHLPPISRRRFFARTLVAGAGMALGPGLFASEKPLNKQFWVLMADPHIANNRALESHGINMARHLDAVAQELTGLTSRAAGAFVIGDCAFNSGEVADYAAVKDLLEPVRRGGIPVHLALGNHDNRERFWEALSDQKLFRRPLADKQAALLRSPTVNWFMLDSLQRTLVTPGLVGKEQLDWLARALDQNAGKPAIVLIHHNPVPKPDGDGLDDTAELLKVIRSRKQVKACIFGHTHDWNVKQDESGIHLINLPPVGYVFQKGKPSGWVRADLETAGIRLELRCVDQTHKLHGQVMKLAWRT